MGDDSYSPEIWKLHICKKQRLPLWSVCVLVRRQIFFLTAWTFNEIITSKCPSRGIMYKNGSRKWLSVDTAAKDQNCQVLHWNFNRLCVSTGTNTHIKLCPSFCVKTQHFESMSGPTSSDNKSAQKFEKANGPKKVGFMFLINDRNMATSKILWFNQKM